MQGAWCGVWTARGGPGGLLRAGSRMPGIRAGEATSRSSMSRPVEAGSGCTWLLKKACSSNWWRWRRVGRWTQRRRRSSARQGALLI